MMNVKPTSILGLALDILQYAFAIVVIILTFWKLIDVDVEGLDIDASCILDGSGSKDAISGTKFCIFAGAVGVISLVVGTILRCLRKICKCVTLNAFSAWKAISIIGDTGLGIWWTVAFVLFLKRGKAANDLGWPERTARDGVIGASFGAAAAFYADTVLTIISMFSRA